MSERIRPLAGDRELCIELGRALLDPERAGADLAVRHEREGRRRLVELRLGSGEELFVKQFLRRGGRHPVRERLKRTFGLATERREWRALSRLHRAGLAVPEPRALAALPNGDRVLATRLLEGRTLREMLPCGREERGPLLAAVAALVARLHAAGFVHRDLHAGNILVTQRGPVLLDLQEARPSHSRRARCRDLGYLDYSLAGALSISDRVRLRAAVLGLAHPYAPPARRRLRAIGHASRTRGRAHAASRTRRCLRPGRRYASIQFGAYRGLRLRRIDEEAIVAALEAHSADAAVLKRNGRSRVTAAAASGHRMVVKEYLAGGLARRIADRFRGSPARRAWLGGHGLGARKIGTATPFAFLERLRLGVPAASMVVLEDLRPFQAADRCGAEVASPATIVDALTALALRLHRLGVDHGDLKASHVCLGNRGGEFEARVLDLDGVRFARRLSDRRRIRALAELNASLPDAIPGTLRCRAFQRYAAALPFGRTPEAALRQIVEISLARAHRWSGSDCAVARASRAAPTPR